MLANDLNDNFQLKVAQQVEAAASAAGRTTLQCQTLGAVERELAHLESFREMGTEGVVVVSVGDVPAQLGTDGSGGHRQRCRQPDGTDAVPRLSALTARLGVILPVTTWWTKVVAAFLRQDFRPQDPQFLSWAAAGWDSAGSQLERRPSRGGDRHSPRTVAASDCGSTTIRPPRRTYHLEQSDLALGIMQELASHGIGVAS